MLEFDASGSLFVKKIESLVTEMKFVEMDDLVAPSSFWKAGDFNIACLRINRVIDDVGKRLPEFVANAGNCSDGASCVGRQYIIVHPCDRGEPWLPFFFRDTVRTENLIRI